MYLEELDARAVLWLPLNVVPVLMHILHVAAAVTSLHKMKHVCWCGCGSHSSVVASRLSHPLSLRSHLHWLLYLPCVGLYIDKINRHQSLHMNILICLWPTIKNPSSQHQYSHSPQTCTGEHLMRHSSVTITRVT